MCHFTVSIKLFCCLFPPKQPHAGRRNCREKKTHSLFIVSVLLQILNLWPCQLLLSDFSEFSFLFWSGLQTGCQLRWGRGWNMVWLYCSQQPIELLVIISFCPFSTEMQLLVGLIDFCLYIYRRHDSFLCVRLILAEVALRGWRSMKLKKMKENTLPDTDVTE